MCYLFGPIYIWLLWCQFALLSCLSYALCSTLVTTAQHVRMTFFTLPTARCMSTHISKCMLIYFQHRFFFFRCPTCRRQFPAQTPNWMSPSLFSSPSTVSTSAFHSPHTRTPPTTPSSTTNLYGSELRVLDSIAVSPGVRGRDHNRMVGSRNMNGGSISSTAPGNLGFITRSGRISRPPRRYLESSMNRRIVRRRMDERGNYGRHAMITTLY